MWEVASANDDTLPETVEISERDIDENYNTWVLWRATGRKFLPFAGGLLDQPERIMMTLITLDGLFGKIESQMLKQEQKDNG